uniref:hypothetical protein n=1 Tax=Flavobacterium sp. TaxID=239 RepID=UPI004048F2B3
MQIITAFFVFQALVIAVEILFEAFSASKRLERKARPVIASSDFFIGRSKLGTPK